MSGRYLCDLTAIPDGDAVGFVAEVAGKQRNILAARRGGAVFAYVNRCPHAGHLLDGVPGRFLSADGQRLRCMAHGAEFHFEDGVCVDGPCPGAALQAIGAEIRDEAVFLVD